MKKAVLIANRLSVWSVLKNDPDIELIKVFVVRSSFLHKELSSLGLEFELIDDDKVSKKNVTDWLADNHYDLLFSNGCPFLLPIEILQEKHRASLFINTHPTYLPELKGKTPLNGIFYLNYNYLGATTHYMTSETDGGNVIYQQKLPLTEDIDQGLVYFISFSLEQEVFSNALAILKKSHYQFEGTKQTGEGTYFNRETSSFFIDFQSENNSDIIRKVRAVGISTQGIGIMIDEKRIKLFEADEILNPYLLRKFQSNQPGDRLLYYSNKILIKSKEGIIRFSYVEQ